MAIFEKGRIFWKGEIKEGISQRGNAWSRMQVVLDVPVGNYSKKIVMDATNDDVQTIASLPMGTMVEAGYVVSAREWQGKWYPSVEMTSVKVAENVSAGRTQVARPASPAPAAPAMPDDDLPFGN